MRSEGLVLRSLLAAIVTSFILSGCASDGIVSKTLQAVGIKDEAPQAPATIPLRLVAGSNLNAGTGRRPSALVLKVYHLRSSQRFEQASFNAFLDQAGEQAALGADLLSVNEIVLMPGVKQELNEKLSDGTGTLGIVALFREPADGRWRFAFDPTHPDLPNTGITIGVHACALTTASPALTTKLLTPATSLGSVRCVATR